MGKLKVQESIAFFKIVQNKLHYVAHGHYIIEIGCLILVLQKISRRKLYRKDSKVVKAVFWNFYGTVVHEVVHIGYSLSSDVKGADALSINSIWVNRSHKEVPADATAIGNLLEAYDTVYFRL